mgnify:FL=1|jgi:hypothetical protein
MPNRFNYNTKFNSIKYKSLNVSSKNNRFAKSFKDNRVKSSSKQSRQLQQHKAK